MAFKYFSTGVIRTGIATAKIHAELVNLDPTNTRQVQVKIKNWANGNIIHNQVYTLNPNSWNFDVDVTLAPFDHYEVRFALEPDIIANVFGYDGSSPDLVNIEGNTILFHQLVPIQSSSFALN